MERGEEDRRSMTIDNRNEGFWPHATGTFLTHARCGGEKGPGKIMRVVTNHAIRKFKLWTLELRGGMQWGSQTRI